MSTNIRSLELDETIEYPDSDGELMAENNEQLRLIFLIKNELDDVFKDNTDVTVEGDLLWYPVKGDNQNRRAPDVMVIFGRPKGYRDSYKQWEENYVPPQVVFEILSPSNDAAEMTAKLLWYETYGVEEYYEYDPDYFELRGWQRINNRLQPIPIMQGRVSPRLKIRFEQDANGELRLYRPDGLPFRSFSEISSLWELERKRALSAQQRAEQEYERAEEAQERAEQERQRAEQERQRAEQERLLALVEKERAEKLATKLRELGIDPDKL